MAPAIKLSDFANAIDRMYEAAAHPALWPEALRTFANSLGGFGGSIVGFSADEKLISYVSPESAEIAAAYARGGWAEHNFRIHMGAPSFAGADSSFTRECFWTGEGWIGKGFKSNF